MYDINVLCISYIKMYVHDVNHTGMIMNTGFGSILHHHHVEVCPKTAAFVIFGMFFAPRPIDCDILNATNKTHRYRATLALTQIFHLRFHMTISIDAIL